jgi:archaellum component FlaF (FlaF/FlaG flagellin family)
MIKPSLKKSALKTLGVSALFVFAFVFLGVNNVYAQTASIAEQVNSVDRDYAEQFETEANLEIQSVRNDSNLDQDEKTVRIKLLMSAVENVDNGLLIEEAFDTSYNMLLPKVNQHAPNVDLKNILLEYKNQFS